MSEQAWLTGEVRQVLHWRLAAWSDGDGYRQATDLAESFLHLLPKPVTTSQLNGLRNIVAAAPDPATVNRFTHRQGQKVERRGDRELRDYWQAVGQALSGLTDVVEEVWAAIRGETLDLPNGEAKRARHEIHLRLMRAFVQHLVAHSVYLKEQPEE